MEAGMTDTEADVITSPFAPVFVLADLAEKVLNRLDSIEGRIKTFEENVDGRFDLRKKGIDVKLEGLEKKMEGKLESKLSNFCYKILAGGVVLTVAGTSGSWVPALIKLVKF